MERGMEIKANERSRAFFSSKSYTKIGSQKNNIISRQLRIAGFRPDKYGRLPFEQEEQSMAVFGPDFQISSLSYRVEFGQSGQSSGRSAVVQDAIRLFFGRDRLTDMNTHKEDGRALSLAKRAIM